MRSYQTCCTLVFAVMLAGAALASDSARCPVSADTWVAMHRWEASGGGRADALKPHGADQELVVRGRESFALLNFDCSAAQGMTVEKAVLRIHRKDDPVPLHTVGLSTISGGGPWQEGAAHFFHRDDSKQPWSYPGSDLVDVTFAQGGSLYACERARDAGAGWWEINVPPALVHALLAADQFGLMLTDEKGQTQTRHVLDSRESRFPPELLLEGTRSDRTAPGAVRSRKAGAESTPEEARRLGRTTLRPGSVILHLGGAGDDLGQGVATSYEIRHSRQPIDAASFESGARVARWRLDPLASKAHPLATSNSLRDEVYAVVEDLQPGASYYFAARATDEAGNVGPVSVLGSYRTYARAFPTLPEAAPPASPGRTAPASSGLRVWAAPELLKIHPVTGALLEQADFPEHRARNSVWNAATSTVRLTGARNEFVAFQLAVESAPPAAGIQIQVSRPLFAASTLPHVFQSTGAVQVYREWFVPDEKENPAGQGWYPDALVPLEGPIDLPSNDNPVPGQTVQPFFVDVYIPKDAAAGWHRGELRVSAGGTEHRIVLEVDVLPLRLPDKLSFIVDLNCYSGVNSGYSVARGTHEYRKLEHAYHRLAHLHRANLDVLGYSHNGTTVPDHAPPLEGEGAATRVRSWADWDAHFGPLLDGSAFADLPRATVPVPAMYLPFFENWPGDLRRSYRHNIDRVAATEEEYREIITRHALEASPVEEAFSREYQERYSAVVSRFAEHLRERGWTNTRFLVYFNNKYYYKRPSQGGRGVSWWLLDEPNQRDDVRAISFLAWLTRRGIESHPDVPVILRTDISRVEWIRDLLAGQIDLNCISRRFFEKNRYLMDDRRRFGRESWNYASTNHPRESNVAMRAWCWRVWLHGGDGLVPWNTVRGAEAWNRAEPLTVFYPGSKFGKNEPYASLRLKAYRRGQQDLEYLALLAQKRGWDRDAVTHAVLRALDLSAEVRMESEEDAGRIAFSKVKDADIETLRLRVVKALLRP